MYITPDGPMPDHTAYMQHSLYIIYPIFLFNFFLFFKGSKTTWGALTALWVSVPSPWLCDS